MRWYKRDYGTASYDREQQRFAKLFMELGGPKGMMMVCIGGVMSCTVYVALSPVLAARNFPEFKEAEAPPTGAAPLFGHNDDLASIRRPDELAAENDD